MTETVTIMRDGELVEVPADTVFVPVDPGPPPVPQAVTRAQAKIALIRGGYYDQAAALIAQAGPEALIWWNEAETIT